MRLMLSTSPKQETRRFGGSSGFRVLKQFGLLTAALAALSELTQLVGEATGEGLPSAYYGTIRCLVALVAVLFIVIEAQSESGVDDSESEG